MGENVTLSIFKMYIVGNDGQHHEVGELKELPLTEAPSDPSPVIKLNSAAEVSFTVHQTRRQMRKTKRAFRKIFGRKLRKPFKVECSVCGRRFNYKKRGFRYYKGDGTNGYACSLKCLHKGE